MKQRKNSKYSFAVIRSMSPTTKAMNGVNIDSALEDVSRSGFGVGSGLGSGLRCV